MAYVVHLMPAISAEEVGVQVQSFWNAFSGKSGQLMEQMYFPSAVVFSTLTRRSEPAHLMLARRLRKFGDPNSLASAKLGPVDVQIAGDLAVASYPYHFHSIKTNNDGSRLEIDAPYSRATQVFQADREGVLRILHEHLSVGEPGRKTELPGESPTAAPATPAGQRSGNARALLRVSETGSCAAAKPIVADEVRTAVRRCWEALSAKSKDQFEAFYFPAAIFFAVDSKRSETARLTLARRTREFFGAGGSVSADLGSIDVQIAGTSAAIASYSFNFQLVREVAQGVYSERDVPFCRATTVFRRDETGALRIWHEHQSTTAVGSSKEVRTR